MCDGYHHTQSIMVHLKPSNNRFFLALMSFFTLAIFAAVFSASHVIILEYETEMYNTFVLLKEQGIENRKVIARDRVHSIVQYLDAEQKKIDTTIREKIKNSVDTAYTLLHTYYERNKMHHSKEEMQKAMLAILREIRWDGGRGYYFIINTNGIEALNPLNISLEGKDVSTIQDSRGNYFVKEMLAIAQEKGSGFVEYVWTKEEAIDTLNERKISYVKHFEPFNWVIATGEYPRDYEMEVKKTVLDKLQSIRFENQENNYVFIYGVHSMDGGDNFATMLINPNRPDLEGQKISDNVQDSLGKAYRKEMLALLREHKEGFVEYTYKAPQSQEMEQKISYFVLYPQWNWIVASGVFLGDIEKEYENNIMNLSLNVDQKIKTFQILFTVLAFLVVAFALGMFYLQKQRMEKTSKEIEELNVELQKRVEREVKQRVALEDEKNMHEKLLIQHAKMAEMGEMIGVITHQWKQPLNTISILTQEITQLQKFGELDDATIAHTTEGIMQQLLFLVQTIDDFRDFFKPDKEKQYFSVNDAIQSILKIFAIQIKVHEITIAFQNSAPHDTVYGVENEFKQVILNILNNAKDIFLEKQIDNSHVTIRLVMLKESILVTLSDNAGGIDPILLPDRIFESYVSTKGDKGTGIGLSMSKMIIEKRFNGSIQAFNNEEGAQFEIVLPLSLKEKKHD